MDNKSIKEEWQQSVLGRRVYDTEIFAINHGYPEWKGETIPDYWLTKMALREKELAKEIIDILMKDFITVPFPKIIAKLKSKYLK